MILDCRWICSSRPLPHDRQPALSCWLGDKLANVGLPEPTGDKPATTTTRQAVAVWQQKQPGSSVRSKPGAADSLPPPADSLSAQRLQQTSRSLTSKTSILCAPHWNLPLLHYPIEAAIMDTDVQRLIILLFLQSTLFCTMESLDRDEGVISMWHWQQMCCMSIMVQGFMLGNLIDT